MDFSKLSRSDAIGVFGGLLLIVALVFLPWYDLGPTEQRTAADGSGFICGDGNFDCTGFGTFPIMRWLLIAAGLAPLILSWIVIRGHKLSWPPGEMTMVVGFTAFMLIVYNGIIDKPGSQLAEIDISMGIGYWVALLATVVIAGAGIARVTDSQKGNLRKTPGTV